MEFSQTFDPAEETKSHAIFRLREKILLSLDMHRAMFKLRKGLLINLRDPRCRWSTLTLAEYCIAPIAS
jgi:hypothetical protein